MSKKPPNRPGITFEIGARLEALDYLQKCCLCSCSKQRAFPEYCGMQRHVREDRCVNVANFCD